MGLLLGAIRNILVELVDRIDNGECATTEEQERRFLALCQMIADKDRRVSKYDACRYLGVSRAKFDRMVADGRIPKGKNIEDCEKVMIEWDTSFADKKENEARFAGIENEMKDLRGVITKLIDKLEN